MKAKWGLIFCVFNMTVGDCLEKSMIYDDLAINNGGFS